MKNISAYMLAALFGMQALSAQALTTSTTAGPTSNEAGAFNVDFGVSAINNSGTVAGALPSGTGNGINYAYTGGGLYNFDNTSNLPAGTSARPVGSAGNFYSIGTNVGQQGPGSVIFDAAVSYFGFLWGSPDAYNTVSFYDGATLLGAFDGSAVLVPPNGNQSFSSYFNVFAGAGEAITRVEFSSTTNAFETDNHAFTAAVPEPESYAMLLAGLGLLGAMARRRIRS